MNLKKQCMALAAVAACLACGAARAQTQTQPVGAAAGEADTAALKPVVVKGRSDSGAAETGYTARRANGATGLNLSLRETPQSVSVLSRSLLDDFKLNSVNDALDAATGVVVEKVETDRTYYTARGFDITNFQVDGIGLPFVYGLVDGDLDTAAYERIEVIRGANGLMSGTGNPSATVNFVRKRPTAALQASAGLTLGSWNLRRLDADVAGPLNQAGSVRGRLVVAAQERDSYLDRYHQRKTLSAGTVEADLGDHTLLTLGHTQQVNRPRGVMWGALPLNDTTGNPVSYDRSTSTAPGWTRWNADTGITFAELQQQLAGDWDLRATLTHKKVNSRGQLFYVYGTPDAATGEGLLGWPSRYDLDNRQTQLDVRASGPFALFGRRHELVLGAGAARSTLNDHSWVAESIAMPVPPLATWDGNLAEPTFPVDYGGSSFVDKQRSLFAATRWNLSDALKLIVGANATRIDSSGTSYGASRVKQEQATTPYVGAVYDLSPVWSVYASRTAIFNPQAEMGTDLQRLTSARGVNLEAGIKREWFDKRLQGSAAVFKTRQSNVATYVGNIGTVATYQGVDTRVQGFEAELAGQATRELKLNAGYTQLSIHDDQGRDTRTFSPRRVLRIATTWQPMALPQLELGGKVNWRSVTSVDTGTAVIRQPSYALLDLMARWRFNDKVSLTANLYNATDRKYYTSLYWTQSLYGAPRWGSLALDWKY